MTDPIEDAGSTVRVLMEAAGLRPSADELAVIVGLYPVLKAGIESLYAIPEVRYEAPGLIFDPDPVFADWAS